MAAHLARIERVNPKVNAIVTLVADRAMADAAKADEQQARGAALGPLHGLPVAHKDLVNTAGIRTTFGSPFYQRQRPDDRRADRDAHPRRRRDHARQDEHAGVRRGVEHVQPRVRRDAQSVQPREDRAAAAAAARRRRSRCGMVPIADGSDTGGSLRNPAAFNNVVGFRPSPGRVPDDDGSWSPLSTRGPMARTVADVALFLSAIAGPDAPRSAGDRRGSGARFRAPLGRELQGRARRVVQGPRRHSVRAGDHARRQRESPGLRAISAASSRTRSRISPASTRRSRSCAISSYHSSYATLAREHPDVVKDTIKWEIAEAERQHRRRRRARGGATGAACITQSATFFEKYDYFVLPVTQVEPFDVTTEYPTSVAGVRDADLHRLDAVVLVRDVHGESGDLGAGGIHASGLPVGLQIVGRHRGEWSVLQMAHAFEQATRHGKRTAGGVDTLSERLTIGSAAGLLRPQHSSARRSSSAVGPLAARSICRIAPRW